MKNYKIVGCILCGLFLIFLPTYASGFSQPDEGFGKSYILFPVVASVQNSDTAYGLLYLSEQLSVGVLYSDNGYRMYFVNERSYLNDDLFFVSFSALYKKGTNTFYGIGNEDYDMLGEDYTGESSQFGGSFLVELCDGLYFGPVISAACFSVSDKETNGQLAQDTIIGGNGTDAVGIGLQLMNDQRDDPSFPTEGSLLDIRTIFYNPDYGSDQKFSQSSATYSKFIPIGRRGVLSFQGRIIYSHGDDIPFQMLPSLGDMNIMRGITVNKDINCDLVAVASDYRFHIYQSLTAGIFGAWGDVASSFHEIQMDKFAGGFELRYNFMGPFKIYYIRGFSNDDVVSYFGVNAGF